MKEILFEKLQEEKPAYTLEELAWLMEYIGDPDPAIRDELVYGSLARGLQEGFFSLEQYKLIVEGIKEDQGIFYLLDQVGIPTLMRSFTALLLANILEVDGDKKSLYYRQLSREDVVLFFEWSLIYLEKEKDWTGYTSLHGWSHAVAHGADYLVQAVCHKAFPQEKWEDVFTVLEGLFYKVDKRFMDDEDLRLARVIYQPILKGMLDSTSVVNWLQGFSFEMGRVTDFYKYSNFRTFLSEVYLQLDKEGHLSPMLKKEIQNYI